MTELVRRDLGILPAGLVHDRIGRDWDRTYPLRGALGGLRLEDGVWWTWAPLDAEIRVTALLGGSLPAGMVQSEAQEQAVQFIGGYLAQGGRLALLEDFEASPSDPWLAKDEPPTERLTSRDSSLLVFDGAGDGATDDAMGPRPILLRSIGPQWPTGITWRRYQPRPGTGSWSNCGKLLDRRV